MEDNEKVFSVTYEIVCIPDITLIKNRIGSTGGLGGLLELHNSFLRIWNKKCLMSNASLHLFYEYIPSEDDRSEEIYGVLSISQYISIVLIVIGGIGCRNFLINRVN